ncbi:methyl-accepting chemotaxis protein [Woodsholea maritima]|uniref:methyl-accepting chemotaxis protein n=1 Tax=Woodsholea maritima TaxID=240237 RepID=UPI000361370B|nr:cache domain-containing protein [Woodsholea maritima]
MFSNLSIGQKLYWAVGGIAACLVLVSVVSAFQVNLQVNNRVNTALEDVTQMGTTTLNHYYGLVQNGALSEEEAKRRALETLAAMRFDDSNYIFIIDYDANMVMHAVQPQLNGTSVRDRQDPNGKYLFRDMVSVVRADHEGLVAYGWPRAGSTQAVPKRSHVREFAPWGMIVGAGVYIDDVNASVLAALSGQLLGLVVLTAVMILGALFLNRTIQKPVTRLCDAVGNLAQGDYDTPLPHPQGREVTALTRAIEILRASAQERAQLESRAQADREAQEARTREIETLIAQFEDQSNHVLKAFEIAGGKLNSASDILRQSSSQTGDNSQALDRASASAADTAEVVAAAAEELTASIGEIAHQVSRSSQVGQSAVERANIAGDDINRLAEAAGKIDGVVRLINDIAEQTNLLALNATIEAARAGEAGKGFAVVASEVKALASQTANATDSIVNEVRGIQNATDKAVEAIQMIRQVIDEMSAISTSIADSMDQQRKAADEIAGSAQTASGAAQEVANAVNGVKKSARESETCAQQVGEANASMDQEVGALRQAVRAFLSGVRAA